MKLLDSIKEIFSFGKFLPKVMSEEEKIAIKNFYDLISLKSADESKGIIEKHLASGFKVKSEHEKILGTDPFIFLWEKVGEANTYCNGKNPNWNLIWDKLIDSEYKKDIYDNNKLLNYYIEIIKLNERTTSNRTYNNIYSNNKTEFFNNNLLNIKTLNTDSYLKYLDDKYKSLVHYPSLNSSEISIVEILVNGINTLKLKSLDTEVNFVFNNENLVKENDNFSQKNITNMLKTLKLYEYKFEVKDKEDKALFINIVENIEKINTTQFLQKNVSEEAYIERLLFKHFPELLSDYLELPDQMKYIFKDPNGRTPQVIFHETLNDINEKISTMLENAFDENITNIRVKNRVMKQN